MSTLESEALDNLSHIEAACHAPPRICLRTELTRNVVAIVDQGLVSGARFLTTILVGRFCGKEVLGVYSLGFTAVLLVACIQEALISLPYSVFANRKQGRARATYSGSTAALAAALAAACSVALAAVTLAVYAAGGPPELWATFAVLTITVPAMAMVELLRRFVLARLETIQVLLMDAVATLVQLGLLALLAYHGRLSAAAAFGAVGLGAFVVSVIWLPSARRAAAFDRAEVARILPSNWHFARWAFASQIAGALRVSILPWLLATLAGTMVTGAFAAIATLASFANPLVLGISSVMIPAASVAFHHHGHVEVRRMVARTTAMCTAMSLGLAVVLVVFRNELLWLIFGSQYAAEIGVVLLLAAGMVLESAGTPPANALWVMHRPRANFAASLLGFVITAVAGAVLIVPQGLLGAAWAFFLGRAAAALAQGWAFWWAVEEPTREADGDGADAAAGCDPLAAEAACAGEGRP